MTTYIDTSALAKWYLNEPFSATMKSNNRISVPRATRKTR